MINIKKLVALDMRLNGRIFIVSEFFLGTVLPLGIIAWFLYSPVPQMSFQYTVLIWLLGNAFNYAPMLGYAISFARNGNYIEQSEDVYSRESIREYSIKQILIFIPFYFFLLVLFQSRMKK